MPPQTVNSSIFFASRAPTYQKLLDIMDTKVLPTKPVAYDALIKTPLDQWTHHAGPPDTAIGQQSSLNLAEQNMFMVGFEVRVGYCQVVIGRASEEVLER